MPAEPCDDPALVALTGLGVYNLIQNLVLTEREYVPANLAATAALVGLARRSGASLEDLGLDPAQLRRGLAMGSVAALVAAGGIGIMARLPGGRRWFRDERARDHGPAEAIRRVLVRFPMGTALFEEVAFRGVLFGLWRRRTGSAAARRTTATAFGAWHLVPTFRLWPQMAVGAGDRSLGARMGGAVVGAAATAVSGFGFAWMRERSGSVAAPWLAHAAINSFSYLAARSLWSRADGA